MKVMEKKKLLGQLRRKSGVQIDEMQAKVLAEARILKNLSHPNIIKLHDIFENDRELCLVMELVDGGELFDYLVDNGPCSEPTARCIMRQLLQARAARRRSTRQCWSCSSAFLSECRWPPLAGVAVLAQPEHCAPRPEAREYLAQALLLVARGRLFVVARPTHRQDRRFWARQARWREEGARSTQCALRGRSLSLICCFRAGRSRRRFAARRSTLHRRCWSRVSRIEATTLRATCGASG